MCILYQAENQGVDRKIKISSNVQTTSNHHHCYGSLGYVAGHADRGFFPLENGTSCGGSKNRPLHGSQFCGSTPPL